MQADQLPAKYAVTLFAVFAYLEEALQPPDLEDAVGDKDAHLEHAPPFDTLVGAFGGVPVDTLAEDDVTLLIFDLSNEFGKRTDLME